MNRRNLLSGLFSFCGGLLILPRIGNSKDKTNSDVILKIKIGQNEYNILKQEFDLETRTIKVMEYFTVDNEQNIFYYNSDDQLHMDNDQPAVIFADGSKLWYKNGQLHRDNDLPAVIRANGSRYWYKNGQLHRDNDLSAVIYANGSKWWYKNGQFIK